MNYKNKNINEIKNDVDNQFDQIDQGGVRDDKEIYHAGQLVANKYQAELMKLEDDVNGLDKNGNVDEHSKEYAQKRTDLRDELWSHVQRLDNAWYAFFTENTQVIESVAIAIDGAENDILELLELHRKSKQEQEKVEANVEASSRDFMTTNEDGSFTLTQETNVPKIHEVLWPLVKEWESWLIDYSWCTNASIKQRMTDGIGAASCYVTTGKGHEGHDTYVLQNNDGKELPLRALIREWVKLTPPGVLAVQWRIQKKKIVSETIAREKESTDALNDQKLSKIKEDPKWSKVISRIPNGLKTALENAAASWEPEVYKEFLELSESRLTEVILEAKQTRMSLAAEPINKSRFSYGGMMEVHFIDADRERTLPFLDAEDHQISDELWSLLDGNSNETDYMNFLTTRIQEKRGELSIVDKNKNLFEDKQENEKSAEISTEEKDAALYGLWMFGLMIKNAKSKERDSWDDDDHEFTQMIQFTADATYSIEQWKTSSEDIAMIIDSLTTMFTSFYWNNINSFDEFKDGEIYENIVKILTWNKQDSVAAIRNLWQSMSIFQNSNTVFLKDEIAKTNDLKLENSEFDTYFQNISKLELKESDQANQEILKKIYNETSAKGLKTTLRALNILPIKDKKWSEWLIKEKRVDHICKELRGRIDAVKKDIEEKTPTKESIKVSLENEYSGLKSKITKSQDEISRLQTLHYLIHNDIDAAIQKRIDDFTEEAMQLMAMWSFVDITKSIVGPFLTRNGWWMTGSNADIYNDITWVGNFNIKDANGDMMKMVATEMAITIAAIWLWMVTAGAATTLILWARLGNAGNKWYKIIRILSQTKKRSRLSKIGKLKQATRLKHANTVAQRARLALTPQATIGNIIWWTAATGLSTVLKWKIDTMTYEEFGKELALNASMIWILRAAQTVFPMTWVSWTINRFAIEESLINPSEYAIQRLSRNSKFWMKEIWENLVIWAVFETILGLFPFVRNGVFAGVKDASGKVLATGTPEDVMKKVLELPEARKKIEDLDGSAKNEASKSIETSNDKIIDDFVDNRKGSLLKNDKDLVSEQELRKIAQGYIGLNKLELNSRRSDFVTKYDQVKGESSAARRERDGLRSTIMLIDDILASRAVSKNTVSPKTNNIDSKARKKREVTQWKYAGQLAQWVSEIKNRVKTSNRKLLPEGVRKFSDNRTKPSKAQIEAVQKEIWMTGKDVDGIFGPNTLKKLDEYLKDFDTQVSKKKLEASKITLETNKKKLETNRKALESNKKKIESNKKKIDAITKQLDAINNQIQELSTINKRMLSLYNRKKKFSDVSKMYFDQIKKIDDEILNWPKKLTKKQRKDVENQKADIEKKLLENNERYEKVKAIVDPELIALQRKKEAIFAAHPEWKNITSTQEYLDILQNERNALSQKKSALEKDRNAVAKKNAALDKQISTMENANVKSWPESAGKNKSTPESEIDFDSITRLTDAQEQKIIDDLLDDPYYREDVWISNQDKIEFVYQSLLLTDSQISKKLDDITKEIDGMKGKTLADRLKREELLTKRKALVDIQNARDKQKINIEQRLPAQLLVNKKLPNSPEEAMWYVEKVGFWLWKNIAWPVLHHIKQSLTWLKNKFATSKKVIDASDVLEAVVDKKLVSMESEVITIQKFTSMKETQSKVIRWEIIWDEAIVITKQFKLMNWFIKKLRKFGVIEDQMKKLTKKDRVYLNEYINDPKNLWYKDWYIVKDIKYSQKEIVQRYIKTALERKSNKQVINNKPTWIERLKKLFNLESIAKISNKTEANKAVDNMLKEISNWIDDVSPSLAKQLLKTLNDLILRLKQKFWDFATTKNITELKKTRQSLKKRSSMTNAEYRAEKELKEELKWTIDMLRKEKPTYQWWVTPHKYVTFEIKSDRIRDVLHNKIYAYEQNYNLTDDLKKLKRDLDVLVKEIRDYKSMRKQYNVNTNNVQKKAESNEVDNSYVDDTEAEMKKQDDDLLHIVLAAEYARSIDARPSENSVVEIKNEWDEIVDIDEIDLDGDIIEIVDDVDEDISFVDDLDVDEFDVFDDLF